LPTKEWPRKRPSRTVERGTRGTPRPCSNCDEPYYPLRHGRCQRCSWYWRRHHRERPLTPPGVYVTRCSCGSCATCRSREAARRRSHGMVLPALAAGRFREPRVLVPSEPATLGYLAGLIDGEGCVRRSGRFGNWTVQIGMTDECLVRWLHSFGGSFQTDRRSGRRKDCHRWRLVAQNDVLVFLRAVIPYLRLKHDLAVQAVAEIEARHEICVELLALERAA
jgi:hypothetical protein